MYHITMLFQLDVRRIILRERAVAIIQRLAVAQLNLRALYHIAELLLWEQEGIIVNVELAAAVLSQNRAVVSLGGIFRRQAHVHHLYRCGIHNTPSSEVFNILVAKALLSS